MRRFFSVGIYGLILAGLSPATAEEGDASPPDAIVVDRVAATVNAHIITVGDVVGAMGSQRAALMREYSGDELRKRLAELFDEACTTLVDRKLIVDAFAEEEEGQIPDWAIDQRVQEIAREQFGGDPGAMTAALAADGKTMEDWREAIREQMIVQAMMQAKVVPNVAVSMRDVREAYAARRQEYERPARARVRLIVLPVEGDASVREAKAIRTRLIDGGQTFDDVAQAVSVGPRAADGGDWGEVALTALRQEVADAARQTPVGDISDVVLTDEYAYIVKVADKAAAGVVPFEEVRAEIKSRLRREAMERVRDAWVASLREKAYIKRMEPDVF